MIGVLSLSAGTVIAAHGGARNVAPEKRRLKEGVLGIVKDVVMDESLKLAFKRTHPILVFDASYYTFYRFFATSKWWDFAKKGEADGESTASSNGTMTNPAFKAAFVKHATADLARMQKVWKVPKENVVFCRDCSRADIWRMASHPEYKGTRAVNDKFDAGAFGVMQEVLAAAGVKVIAMPSLEADDVACVLYRAIRGAFGPEPRVIFITGDHDYLQLKDDTNDIYSMDSKKGKNLWEQGLKKGTSNLVCKMLMGDQSDNIPSVLTKALAIKCAAMATEEERRAFLAKVGPNKVAEYERNRRLMCWSNIPAELILAIDVVEV